MNLTIVFVIALAGWNLIVFFMYAIDKYKAMHNQWRIPEFSLLICTFLFGGLGAFLGMMIARHKTRHLKFRILVPLAALLQFGLAFWLLYRFPALVG
ncbi:MAG: DUF1294 domain-containing protein [Oscillospiraceae bacterium]